MRDTIVKALKAAMKDQDKIRLATLRLIQAAIKDRDIEARSKGRDGVSSDEILAIMTKMIRQRDESSKIYEEAGRLELAAQERKEIEVIREFLPAQVPETEIPKICHEVVDEVGAQGLRDVGKCMGALKSKYAGRMDFGRASGVVKEILK